MILAAPYDNPPVCEIVQVQENGGNGPNYPIKLCGNVSTDIKFLVVDGGAFPEINTTNRRVVFWSG